MDALSDVLATLRVSGSFSSRLEARGPWALRFQGAEAQLKFGTVLAGRVELSVGRTHSIQPGPGDLYLISGSHDFIARSLPAQGPIEDGVAAYRRHRGEDGVVRIGRGGPLVSLLSGRFIFEARSSLYPLRQLPPLIHLRADDDATKMLSSILQLLRREAETPRPGRDLASNNLAGLLLVEALRGYLEKYPQPAGWLAGLRDPKIARAMGAMHADLRRTWTVQELADLALMSRTAFATRFRELVGESPVNYLTQWKMVVAGRLLEETDITAGNIGLQMGYESETAFSAAFKRSAGMPPARYRAIARASR
jgi:AraC-like DNA-binding protein